MTFRNLGLLSLLATLAIGSFLLTQSARTSGSTSTAAERAQQAALTGVVGTNFAAVVPLLEQHRAATGTYAGAIVQPGYGVALVRADATSYCLETGSGRSVQHLVGPNGTPVGGSC